MENSDKRTFYGVFECRACGALFRKKGQTANPDLGEALEKVPKSWTRAHECIPNRQFGLGRLLGVQTRPSLLSEFQRKRSASPREEAEFLKQLQDVSRGTAEIMKQLDDFDNFEISDEDIQHVLDAMEEIDDWRPPGTRGRTVPPGR